MQVQCTFQANQLLYTGPCVNSLLSWSEDNVIVVGSGPHITFMNARQLGQCKSLGEVPGWQCLLPEDVKCEDTSTPQLVLGILAKTCANSSEKARCVRPEWIGARRVPICT